MAQTYNSAPPRVGTVPVKPSGLIGSRVGPAPLPKGKTLVKEHFRTKPKGK